MSGPLLFLTVDGILGKYQRGDEHTHMTQVSKCDCQLPALNNYQVALPVLSL